MNLPGYNKANRREERGFEMLPKDNYVCKIMGAEQTTYKNGKSGLKISFDIAEGEYADFYTKKYQSNKREDRKWSFDAVYYLSIPFDGCEGYVKDGWDTFMANIEDSNNGFVFQGDEKTLKGKLFGGLFRIEQSEYNGRIYEHVRLARTCIAKDIRDGKITWSATDKLVETSGGSSDFVAVPEGAPVDLPF